MSQPVQTFSVGFREDARKRARGRAARRRALRLRHHELELSVTDDTIEPRRARLEPRRTGRRPLRPRLRHALSARSRARHRRARRPGRRRALRRLHEAPRCRCDSEVDFVPGRARAVLGGTRFASARASRFLDALAAPDAASRLLAMSGRLDERLGARSCTGASWPTFRRTARSSQSSARGRDSKVTRWP